VKREAAHPAGKKLGGLSIAADLNDFNLITSSMQKTLRPEECSFSTCAVFDLSGG
jgi:hypothetical protein